jgi:putative transposase
MGTGKRYSEEEVLKILGEVESGSSVAAVCRGHGVTPATVHRWREKYAGMTKSELAGLRRLQEENRRLRHVVAELSLDNAALKELQRGKW